MKRHPKLILAAWFIILAAYWIITFQQGVWR